MWRRDALRTSNVERRVGFCRGGECRLPRTARPCACYGKENVPRTENAMYWGRSVSWGMTWGMSQRWLIDEGVEVCANFSKSWNQATFEFEHGYWSVVGFCSLNVFVVEEPHAFSSYEQKQKNAYDNKKRKSSPDKLLFRPNESSLVSSIKC